MGSVGGDLVVVGEAKFLQAKHVHCLGEGRQWPRVGEAWVDAVQQVEHQLAIQDGVADVAKGVGSLLQLRGVSLDGEVTLGQGGEILV